MRKRLEEIDRLLADELRIARNRRRIFGPRPEAGSRRRRRQRVLVIVAAAVVLLLAALALRLAGS